MSNKQEAVILLHGIARSKSAMKRLEAYLKQADYHVINCGYPSRKHAIESLSKSVIPEALSQCKEALKVHFVTHSMGGILVRDYLRNQTLDNLGKVVMLAPPNQGSELADHLKRYKLFHYFFGIAGAQLGTDQQSIPNQLGKVSYPVGVIAGNKAFNILMRHLIPVPHDGTVSVESTKVAGMTDHLCLPVSHPFIMNDKRVMEQTLYFLKFGHFDHR